MKSRTRKINDIVRIDLFFSKNIKNDFLKNATIFLSILVLTISVIILGYYSYHNQNYVIDDKNNLISSTINSNNWANLNELPTSLRVIRGVFDLLLVWFIFFLVWSYKIAITNFINKKNYFLSFLFMLDFIPLVSLLGFIYNFKFFNKAKIYEQIWHFFGYDENLKQQFKFSGWKRKLILVEWIIYSPVILWFCYPNTSPNLWNVTWTSNYFFSVVMYFTTQSNVLCFVFLTCILIYPQWNIFKNNIFQITASTYIFLVGGVFMFILFPSLLINKNINYWSTYHLVSTFWLHVINPISFLIVSIILMRKTTKKHNDIINQSLCYILVYPWMYSLFLAILPFNTGVSVYGWITNLNNNLAIFVNLDVPNLKYNFGHIYYITAFIGINIIELTLATGFLYWNHRIENKTSTILINL